MALTEKNRRTLPIVVLLASGLLVGCGDDETVVQEAEEEGPIAAGAIMSETVTIQSEVQEILGPNSFTVGEDDTLVVGAGLTGVIEEGDEVQVTGTVRQFLVADFEEDYGIGFDPAEESFLADYEQELVVAADDVQELP